MVTSTSIDCTQLVTWITSLLNAGEDPTTLFSNKLGEKASLESMNDKFHTFIGKSRLEIVNINDDLLQLMMWVLECKILRKCHKAEVLATMIASAEKCTEGVQMNWATFLVDCMEAQEKGIEFHYA
jgi:hypothetical protein